VHVGFIDELGYEIHPDDVAVYAADDPDHDIAVTRPAATEIRIEETPPPRPRQHTRRRPIRKSHSSAG
jgi:hypothetical protein